MVYSSMIKAVPWVVDFSSLFRVPNRWLLYSFPGHEAAKLSSVSLSASVGSFSPAEILTILQITSIMSGTSCSCGCRIRSMKVFGLSDYQLFTWLEQRKKNRRSFISQICLKERFQLFAYKR
jgi:hypothetical protein